MGWRNDRRLSAAGPPGSASNPSQHSCDHPHSASFQSSRHTPCAVTTLLLRAATLQAAHQANPRFCSCDHPHSASFQGSRHTPCAVTTLLLRAATLQAAHRANPRLCKRRSGELSPAANRYPAGRALSYLTKYTGRRFASSNVRERYSPISPVKRSCTPFRINTVHISEPQPGMRSPTSQ